MKKLKNPISMVYKIFALTVVVFLAASGCKKNDSTIPQADQVSEETLTASNPLLVLLTPAETGIDFQNLINESYEDNITTNINKYNGGGLAIADVNNDGLPDIYFISCNGKNRLYLNEGDMKFRDITDAAGVASEEGFETAATAVDINADGWLDFYVCRGGVGNDEARRNKLYVNNGLSTDGKGVTFSERAHEYGLDDQSASTGANFFDYDNDGDLDMYLLNYPTESIYTNKIEAKLGDDDKYHPVLEPRARYDTHRFYRNDGGKFTDVSKEAGVWNLAYGLSVSVSDINRDGWPDVYVGNDFIQPDILYLNNKNGTFSDRIADYFKHSSQHTMGTDLTDFDNDGLVDLYAVDMLSANNYRRKSFLASNTQSKLTALEQNGYFNPVVRNVLQRNNGNGTFSDIGCMAGVFETDWSWSGLLFDMDNDGLRDLHVTNGYRREVTNRDFIDFTLPEIQKSSGGGKRLRDIYPDFNEFLKLVPTFKVRNFCFQNKGNWRFDDASGRWMTIPATWSCGAAWADFDADGDLDLVINNLEESAFVYENKSKGQPNSNFLQIKLQGSPKNPFAIGASAAIYYNNGQVQYLENYPTRGIFSSVEHLLHLGLGNAAQVDKLIVRWPDGKTQTLSNVPANQRLSLKHADASGYAAHIGPTKPAGALFANVSAPSGIHFTHHENEYNDFENWPLNTWKVTELGPLMAKGDVNGDGLEDFYIGNAFNSPGALYVQTSGGAFRPVSAATWEADKLYEDHGALFFDADADGDQDLFVVSGGAEATSPQAWQNRLYINTDGKGNFAKAQGAIPQSQDVGLRVAAHDYDGDGDADLFIGGRVTPAKWPLTPRSLVLRNDKTRFTDVSAEIAPAFERCGMVADLKWANVDSDPQPELIVVGEWMPVSIFKLINNKLENVTAQYGLEKSNGLWFSAGISDLDGDGDLDLVTGNLGLNTRFSASADAPFRCFAKDFDNNGTLDPIVAYHEDGNLYPLMQKEVLNKQMPPLKKKFLYAKDYGTATMDKVWPQKDLDGALNLFCYTLESCWWENQGGKFVRRSLPVQAQVSVVQGIAAEDFNGDGNVDLLLAGNKYGFDVETNRCDSGNGALLAGDGKGNFSWVNNQESGFWAMKEARDLVVLRAAGGKRLIVVSNNHDKPQLYRQ